MNIDPDDLPGERWADIPGYQDIYQLSDHGRLRTVDREIVDKNGVKYFKQGRMRTIGIAETDKTVVSDPQGRKFIGINIILIKETKQRSYALVRYVYYLFVEKFDLENQAFAVIKKDNDIFNCHYSNLQLVSVSELISDGFANKGRQSGFHKNIKPVHQYSSEGNWLKTYDSVTTATKETNGNASAIADAAKKMTMLAGGFYWRYGEACMKIDVSGLHSKRERYRQSRRRKVQQLTLKGVPITTFDSISAASKALGIVSSSIRNSCNNPKSIGKGFYWRFVDEDPVL